MELLTSSKTDSSLVEIEDQWNYSKADHLPQLWLLTLKSIQTIKVEKLVKAKVFENLVEILLSAEQEVQEIAYPDILELSKGWLVDINRNKQFTNLIISLIFKCMKRLAQTPEPEPVVYSLCQGWVNIMLKGKANEPL